MRLGVLFSGGKDSVYACYRASKTEDVACLITVVSENEESYMFHTPNIDKCPMIAKAMGIPYLEWRTLGEKEAELDDLRYAIAHAISEYGIEGVVTGAIASVYQASRVQWICNDLGIWCFNPLWQIDQLEYLDMLLSDGFKVLISGVFAYPLDESWIGRQMDQGMLSELAALKAKYGINPSGEGGEIETMVVDGPSFKRRIKISSFDKDYKNHSGRMMIKDARLVEK
ncbi:MAG: diphthine--ammonia ligase [Candidatus Methanofastidiosa archaeon]|nr:diphthine--ammonia ligase [Candidatus Methanofastidiosa archaeon]